MPLQKRKQRGSRRSSPHRISSRRRRSTWKSAVRLDVKTKWNVFLSQTFIMLVWFHASFYSQSQTVDSVASGRKGGRGAGGLRCKDVTRPAGVWQAVGILATGAATWGYRWVRCWPDTSSISGAASHRSLALTSSWGNRETEAGFGRGERGWRGKAGKDTRRREVKRTRDKQKEKKGGK